MTPFFSVAFAAEEVEAIKVVASIGPYGYFASRIGGEHVTVYTLVPAGASSHSYEPTVKQILDASKADLWFSLFERYEVKAIASAKKLRPAFSAIDLKAGVNLITEHTCSCVGHESFDPHLWLSSRIAKIQAKTIAGALIAKLPRYKKLFTQNLASLEQDLDNLDLRSQKVVESLKQKVFLSAHPAYGYFARDYGIKQLSIEVEGKDPTAKQLAMLIKQAKGYGIKAILTQPQYSAKGAVQIARQLNAELIEVNPYASDYFSSMNAFLDALGAE
jgi:zinc transport system substrate-binding protein